MENKDKSELPIIKHTSEDKLFNYLCEIGATPIDTEIHEIRLIVYEELGLKELSTEQIEELKVWLKSESTTLMFDYVAKNRLLETENERLKNVLKEIGNTFKPKELSMWDFVDILRDKAKQALNGK